MIWDRLDPAFLAIYEDYLADFGVRYWNLDGLTVVHWWPMWVELFRDRQSGEMDTGDAITNANYRAVVHLIEERYDGRIIGGKRYIPSDEMIRLRTELASDGLDPSMDLCSIMYRAGVIPD